MHHNKMCLKFISTDGPSYSKILKDRDTLEQSSINVAVKNIMELLLFGQSDKLPLRNVHS